MTVRPLEVSLQLQLPASGPWTLTPCLPFNALLLLPGLSLPPSSPAGEGQLTALALTAQLQPPSGSGARLNPTLSLPARKALMCTRGCIESAFALYIDMSMPTSVPLPLKTTPFFTPCNCSPSGYLSPHIHPTPFSC